MYRHRSIDLGTIAIILIVALAIALIVAAAVMNEKNRISSGEVIDKQVEAGYSDFHASSKAASAHSRDTAYYLLIRGEKDGKTVEYWREVSADEYSRYEIGDWYGNRRDERK